MTTTKRIKPVSAQIITRAEVDRIVRETVRLQLEREAQVVERDKDVADVQEPFNKEIDKLGADIELNMLRLQQWADANEGEFPKDARSLKIDGHTLGYRLGNYTATTLKGFTWPKAMAALLKMRKVVRERFTRVKIEPDKEAMIAARTHPNLLARFGVQIVQGETFYLDPNREGHSDVKLQGEGRAVAA